MAGIERLGKYEIRGLIGRGTMGTVYEGWDPYIHRRVAIKTVRLPDSTDSEEREQLERFRKEAQSAGRLHHPNVVGVYDYGETDELAYIVMEFVDGRTLKAVLDSGMRPDLPEVGRLMDGLLTGLDYSHRNQVIHRDIKPANVIVTSAGVVKIADFGIARIAGSTMTQAGTIMGTPAYMSPEQFQGVDIDSRTDVYSAGVALFQLLTGKRPFEGSMATIMHAVLNKQAPRPSEIAAAVPSALDGVVSCAMARTPDDRFPTAAAFNQALKAALGGPTLPAGLGGLLGDPLPPPAGDEETVVSKPRKSHPPERIAPRPQPLPVAMGAAPERRSRAPLLVGIAAVMLIAIGGAYWTFTRLAPVSEPAEIIASTPAPPPPLAAPPGDAERQASAPDLTPPRPAETASPAPSREPDLSSPQPGPTLPALPASVAPAANPMAIRQAVAAALRDAPCSILRADSRPDIGPTLRGVIGEEAEEGSLRATLRTAAPNVAFDWQVAHAERSYCALLDTLRPYAQVIDGDGEAVGIVLADDRTDLVADDLVVPRVTMPDFTGGLEIDYLTTDGRVLHLHEALAGVPYAARSTPTFGEPKLPEFGGWAVDRPFGTDLMVVIASSLPLFQAPRPAEEKLDAYLRDLIPALNQATHDGARISTAALVVRTRPKR